MHNLNSVITNGGGGVNDGCNSINLNLNLTCDSTANNKSMSLSHPSLSQALSRSRYLTAVDTSSSPLWTALTTAQVITVDYADENELS